MAVYCNVNKGMSLLLLLDNKYTGLKISLPQTLWHSVQWILLSQARILMDIWGFFHQLLQETFILFQSLLVLQMCWHAAQQVDRFTKFCLRHLLCASSCHDNALIIYFLVSVLHISTHHQLEKVISYFWFYTNLHMLDFRTEGKEDAVGIRWREIMIWQDLYNSGVQRDDLCVCVCCGEGSQMIEFIIYTWHTHVHSLSALSPLPAFSPTSQQKKQSRYALTNMWPVKVWRPAGVLLRPDCVNVWLSCFWHVLMTRVCVHSETATQLNHIYNNYGKGWVIRAS